MSKQLAKQFKNSNTIVALQEVYSYFEKNGSILKDVYADKETVLARRQLPNRQILIDFKFTFEQNKWRLDSIGNLELLVSKIHSAQTQASVCP